MSRRHRGKRSKSCRSRSQSIISDGYDLIETNDDADANQSSNFDVKVSKIMGRYMVAKKHFKPGHVILSEEPLVVGPCTGCRLLCLGCYKNLEESLSINQCSNCKWPLCGESCQGFHQKFGHTLEECTILKECNSSALLDYSDLESIRTNLHAIAPLRCLLLKINDPSAFDILMNMENHNEIRKKLPDVWNGNQLNIVNRILYDWGLTEYTAQEIHTICGILEVNAFEIGQQGVNIRGLYPTAYLMSHDCIPNTNHIDEVENYRLTVRASTKIEIDQPITLSYAYTLQGTLKRRQHLLENKFFECRCQRCSDPTELGTYTSALFCPKCKTGLVLSKNPLDPESIWSCNQKSTKCPGYSIPALSVRLLTDRISTEIEVLDCNDVKGMEFLLSKYRNVLHPTHYLFLGLKTSLSQLYGKIEGYLIYKLDEKVLMRKRDLCKEILNIFNIIEPGFTRIRGVTLYEIHAPLMLLLTRSFEDGSLTNDNLKKQLREVVQCLVEASVILSHEPITSSEGMMGKAAKEALLQIKDWEKVVGKI